MDGYISFIFQKRCSLHPKKKITKDTLPAVTQLFTPDWIVKYMAENSIGHMVESYPNSLLKNGMKYYVEEAEQTEEVKQKELEKIRYKNVNPEDIKIIEPACWIWAYFSICIRFVIKDV